LKPYLTGNLDEWISNVAKYYRDKYADPKKAEWVKEGIIESFKVVTDTYKSLVLAIASGLVSWMVAQVPSTTRIIPLQWNLIMIGVAAVLIFLLHLRMSYKISLLNSRLDAICGVEGEILEAKKEEE
jgi:hypothetical protein